ncbi:uncharacterized protein EI97DRAFT_451823 [Westerdykella ornata]|uniref:Uncharacterized protein n=1 Tax=Westerdykella ornata TaxID=318751 RepID=A0A6A6JCB5_WESOR|nr:uncharacterized protein EI97DRAFT_451823 [Westerdykella ornata]KAF2274260.1 hypothetical protein EI97DRAFT_451823 [Westerdykella ornata]
MPAHMRPSWCPSPSEVRQKAREYTTRLFQDRDTLQQILERHETTIRKRWTKKTNSQKKKILLQAWPNMSTQHRPDVEAWRRQSTNRDAYLWPYINLEDLFKTKSLLLLLHSRGRHQPHEFVHSDLEQARLGEITRVIQPGFLNGFTMLFHGRTTPDTYGDLVDWDDGEMIFEFLNNGLGMHPGHGLVALEIQQRLSSIVPNPGPPHGQQENVTSLEIMAAEAPYRVPARLDIKRLLAMTVAECDAREEHIWALREDPSYFAEVMEDWAAHRPEVLLDAYGRKHPSQTKPGRPVFWNIVVDKVVVESYLGFATFDHIVKQVKDLESLLSRHASKIKPEDDLPADLMEAFQNLRFTLDAAKKGLIEILQQGLFSSPPIRQFCHRQQNGLPAPPDHGIHRIMPLFQMLFDDEQLFLFGLHTITDEIGHSLEHDRAVKAAISPWVASHLSSLSTPWARKIEDGVDQNEDKLLSTYAQTFGKTVEAARAAESNLDTVWKELDQHYRASGSRKSPHDLRTAPWVEKEKQDTVSEGIYDRHAFSGIRWSYLAASISCTINRASMCSKHLFTIKSSSARDEDIGASIIPHETVDTKPVFRVDRRAYKVFKSLFYSADHDLPGEISWFDFLHAMVTVGFSAERLHGSAWNFAVNGSDIGVERSIQFHEPHPSSKVPFHVGRRYGRRLARAYGWSGDAFRLE